MQTLPTTNTTAPGRVFIAEQPNHSISLEATAAFGVITTVLTERGYSAFDPAGFVQRARTNLELLEFDPSRDHFCIVGPVASVALVLSMLFIKHRVVNVLLFNKHNSKYSSRTIDLRSLETVLKAD